LVVVAVRVVAVAAAVVFSREHSAQFAARRLL
jgi:hypothetical protein